MNSLPSTHDVNHCPSSLVRVSGMLTHLSFFAASPQGILLLCRGMPPTACCWVAQALPVLTCDSGLALPFNAQAILGHCEVWTAKFTGLLNTLAQRELVDVAEYIRASTAALQQQPLQDARQVRRLPHFALLCPEQAAIAYALITHLMLLQCSPKWCWHLGFSIEGMHGKVARHADAIIDWQGQYERCSAIVFLIIACSSHCFGRAAGGRAGGIGTAHARAHSQV